MSTFFSLAKLSSSNYSGLVFWFILTGWILIGNFTAALPVIPLWLFISFMV